MIDWPRRRRRSKAMEAKIAPRRRLAGEQKPPAPPPRPPSTSYLPKHELPAPRGRFTRVDSTRSPMEVLLKAAAKEDVEALAAQAPTRIALRRMLEPGYTGRKGAALRTEDVEAVLSRHGLLAGLQGRERDTLLSAVAQTRGALGRAAHALDMTGGELTRLLEQLELERQIDELRTRFAREALAANNLAQRLELVGRKRYLADLRIEKKFATALERDLTSVLDALDTRQGLDALVDLAARQHGLRAEAIHDAVEKLGLSKRYR